MLLNAATISLYIKNITYIDESSRRDDCLIESTRRDNDLIINKSSRRDNYLIIYIKKVVSLVILLKIYDRNSRSLRISKYHIEILALISS